MEELNTYTSEDLGDLNLLMHELSPSSSCTQERLDAVIGDDHSHLYVIREEGRIVAAATLCVNHTPEFTIGAVEAVVVSSVHRGRGYGRQMIEHLLSEAGRFGCDRVHLTSSPGRTAANLLYQKAGFLRHETNCYVQLL